MVSSGTRLNVDDSAGGVAKLGGVERSGIVELLGATLTTTAICSTIFAKLFIVPWMVSMEAC